MCDTPIQGEGAQIEVSALLGQTTKLGRSDDTTTVRTNFFLVMSERASDFVAAFRDIISGGVLIVAILWHLLRYHYMHIHAQTQDTFGNMYNGGCKLMRFVDL